MIEPNVYNNLRVCGYKRVQIYFFSGVALFSTIYKIVFGERQDIRGYAIFLICMNVLVNIVAMVILKKIPLNEDKLNQACDDQNDGNGERTNPEKKKLLQEDKSLKLIYYGEYNLCQAVKTQDFHWIIWPCVMAQSVAFTYAFSLPVYLKSFDLLSLETPLLLVGPMLGLCSKLASGILSDLTLSKCPRVVYLIIILSCQILGMLLNTFIGDMAIVVIINTICQFITVAAAMVMTPIILSDCYGTTYFPSIWGTFNVFAGFACFIMSYTMGALYDREVPAEEESCYGLKCFRIIFIISTLLCTVSLIMLLVFYKRQRSLIESRTKEVDSSTLQEKIPNKELKKL